MHDYKEYHVMSVKDSLLCDRLSQISPSFCHTLYGNELIKVQAPFGSLHCGDTAETQFVSQDLRERQSFRLLDNLAPY